MRKTIFCNKVLSEAIFLVATLPVIAAPSFAVPQEQEPASPPSPPAQTEAQPPAQTEAPPPEQPQNAQLTEQQLEQLLAPIALYPDALVAQILAASAYPTQIVEAERFLQQSPDLKGEQLAAEVDKQDWDPSVKALTQFPSVLANMDKDLSWTSEVGDANYNQQADVMNAIQSLRAKAKQAGTLKSTPQQTVTDQGDNIDIQPADPNVVYVPVYDPGLVYGYPIGLWPGFYPWWGVGGPYISFGVGFGIGPFFGYGWGWNHWGFEWGRRGVLYGGGPYAFHSHAFYDRNAYFHGNYRGGAAFGRGDRGMRGYGNPGGRAVAPGGRVGGGRPGAFGGISRGGDARGFSSRGQASFGGGGGMHGGGGHGGGGRR
jgi:uncharacterized membrane protein YgcG